MPNLLSLRCAVCGHDGFIEQYAVIDLVLDFSGEWSYGHCAMCGHGALSPQPSPEALGALYARLYAPDKLRTMIQVSESGFEQRLQRARLRAIERVAPEEIRRILDVGCGLGSFLERLARQYPHAEAIGVELAPQTAEIAAKRPGLTIHQIAFMDLSLESGSVDLLTMNHLLEHLTDPAAQLRRAADLLAPGGLLAVEIPYQEGWGRRWFGRWYWGHLPPQHLQLFTKAGLCQLLRAAGFAEPAVVERAGYPMNLTAAMVLWIQHRFGSRSPYARRWGVRGPMTLLGLLALPMTIGFDLTVGVLLNRTQGDILRVVARKNGFR